MTITAAPSTASAGMWQPMRHPHFRRFFFAAIVSNAGSWMQSIAVPFTVYEITNSKSWLGISAFVGLFVGTMANTPGGMLADRYSRRLVLTCTQLLQMTSALLLWALWTFGHPSIASMMPLLILGAIGGGLTMPVWQSFFPSLVPSHEVSAAIRLNSMQFAVARSVGPVLGAITLKVFGPSVCFMVNAVTYPVIIAAVALVPEPSRAAMADRAPLRFSQVIADVADGWRYLRTTAGLRYAPMAVFVNAAFGFGLTTLAPALARDQFHHKANDNGTLVGGFGIGGVIGVVAVGMLARRSSNARQLRSAFVAWTAASVGLAITHSFWIGFAAFAVAGLANSVGGTALNTSVQMQTEDQYRGRVMGIYMQMFFLGSALGSLGLGVLADVASLQVAAGLSAVAFMAFHVWSMLRFDGLRVLDAAIKP